METVTAIATADFSVPRTVPATDTARAGIVSSLIEAWRRKAANRRLRDTLADMDDALLRDIGIADDEIYRVRSREQFTPRAWSNAMTRKAA